MVLWKRPSLAFSFPLWEVAGLLRGWLHGGHSWGDPCLPSKNRNCRGHLGWNEGLTGTWAKL